MNTLSDDAISRENQVPAITPYDEPRVNPPPESDLNANITGAPKGGAQGNPGRPPDGSVVQLPERMPEGWVQEIKTATKNNLFVTMLGSSVIAAIISGSVAIYTTNRTAESNRTLEVIKQTIQTEVEQAKRTREAYLTLEYDLRDLEQGLQALLSLFTIIGPNVDKESENTLQKQIRQIGTTLIKVLAAAKAPWIEDSEVREQVQKISQRIPIILSSANTSLTTVHELLIKEHPELKQLLTKAAAHALRLAKEQTAKL